MIPWFSTKDALPKPGLRVHIKVNGNEEMGKRIDGMVFKNDRGKEVIPSHWKLKENVL